MTSANLSLSEKFSIRKKYITRTLWTSYIAVLIMAVYYILGVIMMVSRSINYGRIYHQTEAVIRQAKLSAVTRVMGFEQFGFFFIGIIAIAFAFQGFSYCFDQKKIDFYLSQPTTRAQRLRKTYLDALCVFVLIYVAVEAVALLAAALMGAVNSVVLVSVLLETLRSILFFFAIYNISVLAILLCGNMVIAFIVLAFLLALTPVVGGEILSYKELFYYTHSYYEPVHIYASPFYDRISDYPTLIEMARSDSFNLSFASINNAFGVIVPGLVDTLVVSIISLILVDLVSRLRKSEHAGQTIVFRPFRWFIKVTGCVVVGLAAGIMFYYVYDYVWNDKILILMLVIMLLATAICGCIVEAILEENIRKFFAGRAQTIMAVALVALIFVIFKGDLLGYDSYIPDASKVESCGIDESEFSCNMFYNGTNYFDTETAELMYITDIDTFLELARIGMNQRREEKKASLSDRYVDYGWETDIIYRMKNGKKVFRRIAIPYDVDKKLLSKIIDSDEFLKGYFCVFNDDALREFDEKAQDKTFRYNSDTESLATSKMSYAELSDALRKDALENFSYDMVSKEIPIGSLEYEGNMPDNAIYSYGYGSFTVNIYKSYSNTIELLKKYDIYSDNVLDVQYIESIKVFNNYPGHDLNVEDIADSDDWEYVDSKSAVYDDEAQMQQILDNSRSSGYYSQWFNSRELDDQQYHIEILLKKPKDMYGTTTIYYTFNRGRVPDFVIKDTN